MIIINDPGMTHAQTGTESYYWSSFGDWSLWWPDHCNYLEIITISFWHQWCNDHNDFKWLSDHNWLTWKKKSELTVRPSVRPAVSKTLTLGCSWILSSMSNLHHGSAYWALSIHTFTDLDQISRSQPHDTVETKICSFFLKLLTDLPMFVRW